MNSETLSSPGQRPLLVAAILFVTSLVSVLPAAAASKAMDLARQLNDAFVEAAAEASRSVVVIEVTMAPEPLTAEDADSLLERLPDWFKEQFLPEQGGSEDAPAPRPRPRQPETFQANGSGIIIREDGHILTNAHVVDGAKTIRVRLQDGREFDAEVRGIDELSEVAVIRLLDESVKDLPVAKFADSDKVRVGEYAIAIGTPYALDYSVTVGHVSAKGRADIVPWWMNGNNMDQDFIQTDANINPGNSGGPLVNLDGRVIGINTLIRGMGTGIGFAIPSNLARTVADELIKTGTYQRAWLGIEIIDLNDFRDRESLAPGVKHGLVVRGIPAGAPAASSDLKPSDVIVSVNNRPVKNIQDLRAEVRSKPLGSTLDIGVVRRGKELKLKVETGSLTEEQFARIRGGVPRNSTPPPEVVPLGIEVAPLSPELREKFGLTQEKGVVITGVRPGSPAADLDLTPGMVITDLDYKSVDTLEDYQQLVKKADPAKGVVINYSDADGNSRFAVLKEE